MAIALICVHPFRGYKKGQQVTDPKEIARLEKERAHNFVRVAVANSQPLASPEEEGDQ